MIKITKMYSLFAEDDEEEQFGDFRLLEVPDFNDRNEDLKWK